MTTISLGRVPDTLELLLTPGDPLTAVLRRYDKPAKDPSRAPVPWTEPPTLEFPSAGVPSWAATVTGHEATFAVPAVTVDALLATGKRTAQLTVGGVVWARGSWKSV